MQLFASEAEANVQALGVHATVAIAYDLHNGLVQTFKARIRPAKGQALAKPRTESGLTIHQAALVVKATDGQVSIKGVAHDSHLSETVWSVCAARAWPR